MFSVPVQLRGGPESHSASPPMRHRADGGPSVGRRIPVASLHIPYDPVDDALAELGAVGERRAYFFEKRSMVGR